MENDTLDVLLIEDNPGDARLVEEMLREAQDLLHRINIDGQAPERVAFTHEQSLSSGFEYLSENSVHVILLDLGLPESTGLDTLATVVEETEFTPIVVLTGLDDRERGIQAIQGGAQDYLVKDEVTGELLVHSIQYAIEQVQQESERVRYRKKLEALNELNTISQEITHDVITTSSREDLEQAVCARLVESDAYHTAWIGEVDRRTEQLSPRATAGDGGIFDDISIEVDGQDGGERPEVRAVHTREVQLVQRDQTTPTLEHLSAHESEFEYHSIAAIPLCYRAVFYGVLTIYATSPHAFSDHELAVLSRLGDVIGHAITSLERKNALVSDTTLQLEFRWDGVAEELVALTTDHESTLEFDNIIRSDRGLLVYGRAQGLPRAAFKTEAEHSSLIEDLRILSSGENCYDFEFITDAVESLDTAIATHGGRVASASIDAGEFRFVVEFPQSRDKRQTVELVEEICVGAELQAHRTAQREDPSIPDFRAVFQNRLSEKQRAALKTAYHAGYFEWPRTTSGDEIADRLGVSQATFSQHFRAAERKFFDAVFESEEGTSSSPWRSLESEATND